MKRKKRYEAPMMTEMVVELEHGFMKSSILDDEKKGISVTSNSQDYAEFDSNAFDTTTPGANDAGITWE